MAALVESRRSAAASIAGRPFFAVVVRGEKQSFTVCALGRADGYRPHHQLETFGRLSHDRSLSRSISSRTDDDGSRSGPIKREEGKP